MRRLCEYGYGNSMINKSNYFHGRTQCLKNINKIKSREFSMGGENVQ